MKFLRIIICFSFIFLSSNYISAQSLEWSNTTKIRGNSIYTTVIGEDESGIYIMRHRNKLLSRFVVLERYRLNLGLETSKSFLMKNSRILFADINKNGMLVIKQIYSKKTKSYSIVANYLNSVFEPKLSDELLMNIEIIEKNIEPKIIVKFDETHSNYLLVNTSNLTLKNKSYEYTIFDFNFTKKKSNKIIFDKKYKLDKINDVCSDFKNCITLLAECKQPQNPYPDYCLIEQCNDKYTIKSIVDSNYIIDQIKITSNDISKSMIVTGLYTSAFKSGYEGQFFCKFRDLASDSLIFVKTPFSKEILKETEGEINSQYGFLPITYKTIKLINCIDGGIVKIIENTIINKDQEIMMINGNPTAQGKYIYIFENVIIQNFDSSGTLKWENNINKIQNSVNDGGLLSSVFVSNTFNKINIIYNDPITNGGDIILVDINSSGKKESRKIVDGELFNALLIPEECRQISNNKIIVPVIKERKFALLKIQF